MAGKIKDVLAMLPYKPINSCDHLIVDDTDDEHLNVGSFSQRLQSLLQVHHPTEFPHVFACGTPYPNTDTLEEKVEYRYPGYTELAPLHSFLPWLEVLNAHNVRVSYTAKAFMAAEMSESQLIEMTSASINTCDADDKETKEKDIMLNCDGSSDKDGYSSSDDTIIDVSSDSETVDFNNEGANSSCNRNNSYAAGCELNCSTDFIPVNGNRSLASGIDLEVTTGCMPVNCSSSCDTSTVVFPNELKDSQFEATCENLCKLEQEIEQLRRRINEENEKHDVYSVSSTSISKGALSQ